VDGAALDALVDTFEHKIGPRNGARVVAKEFLRALPYLVIPWGCPSRRLIDFHHHKGQIVVLGCVLDPVVQLV